MTVDLDYLKEIIAVAKESGLSEIEVTEGERTYRCVIQSATPQLMPVAQTKPIEVFEEVNKVEPKANYHQVKSPMVGTVYLAASPGDPPFVKEGQMVKQGDVLCLVEAMKMFNKVKADRAGTIKSCLIKDGGCAEFDQVLYEID